MKTFKHLALLFLSASIFTSCAITNRKIVIHSTPSITFHDETPLTKVVSIGEVKDLRGFPDDKILFFKTNLYNQFTKGKYIAQEPIASLVGKFIQKSFDKRNIATNLNEYDLQLNAQLIDIDYVVIQGWISNDVITKTAIKFTLTDKDKNLLWTDTIIGSTKDKPAQLEAYLPQTLDNVLDQLLNRTDFIKFLK